MRAGKLEKTTIEGVFHDTIEFYNRQIHSATKESGNCKEEVIHNRVWETKIKAISI